jgi:polar amino acid transport system substrate-binding protein
MRKYVPLLLAAALALDAGALCAGDSLTIVAEAWPPFVFEKDGQATGIDVEIAQKVFGSLGVKYTIKVLPWECAWKMLEEGTADIGLMVSKKAAREPFVTWPQTPVWDATFVLMTNQETKRKYDIKSYDDVKKNDLKVGIVRGNSYNEDFWKAFPWQDGEQKVCHPQLDPATSFEQCLKKLGANRIQVLPIVKTVGLYSAKELKIDNLACYDWVLFAKPYPNAFSKKSAFGDKHYAAIGDLMTAYDKALAAFKAGPEFKAIFDKYEK